MYARNGEKQEYDLITSSRVDMLLAIYDAAIKSVDEVLKAMDADVLHETAVARSRAIVLVGLIENGLDVSQGEIPNRIKELCKFIEQSLLADKRSEIVVSRQILKNLRDGFSGIRDDAKELESTGKIPQLSSACSINTVI